MDHKEGWALKNWCFQTVVLERTLESPLDCNIKQVHPKGNQPWIFIGRTDAEVETPILWPPDEKNWLIWEDPDAGKEWRQEEKGRTEDETVGSHHQLNGREFEQTLGDSEGQGGMACCSPWGCRELDTTEDWTPLNVRSSLHVEHMLSWTWLRTEHLWMSGPPCMWNICRMSPGTCTGPSGARCHQGPKRKEVAGWVQGLMESRAAGGQRLTELQRMRFKRHANMRWVPLKPGGKVQPRIREKKHSWFICKDCKVAVRTQRGTRMTLLVARDRSPNWTSLTERHSTTCYGMFDFAWSRGIDSSSVCCKPEGS